MTLCFVLCPFDFGVLSIHFCMLCSLFVYNVAHFKRRNSRGRAKMENKPRKVRREYKYFNSSVVMLVFYIFEIDAGGNYHSQKVYRRLSV